MNWPKIKPYLDTSEDNIISELYTPCLKWADRYDRGVGYFTTGWIQYNIYGLSDFASRGGKMRLITSPILSNSDLCAIRETTDDTEAFAHFTKALSDNVDTLRVEMEKDILNTFSWLIYDGIIDLKFAVPCKDLQNGNFHDKFGVFYCGNDALSFSGSLNDSNQGHQNYESIKVFSSWSGTKEYVDADAARFEKIWNDREKNLRMYTVPEAIKDKIFKLRSSNRPYKKPKDNFNKWLHQDIAVEMFLQKQNGILAMATGTGKTITAIKIIKHLFKENKIKRAIITMYGNDLIDQWAIQMRENFPTKTINYHYGSQKMMKNFVMHPDNTFLLVSREAGNLTKLLDSFEMMPGNYYNDSLFVFDEVHGAGSESLVENLSGKISPYRFRLGLSATPKREYDEEGNEFLLNEIGDVIYTFSLEDAIKKGILCEFNYIPLDYELTNEEKKKKRDIIAGFSMRKARGESVDEAEMYRKLASVNKTAVLKIREFEKLVLRQPELLKNSIIFVETREFGRKLQDVLIKRTDKYHTYYADDERINLENFSNGIIECLLTCQKISEGIDISSVTNIILFSSDRSKLVTTQRIGRALRLNANMPEKTANVIDFILITENDEDENSDVIRKEWLTELSKTRREEHAK